MKVDIKFCTSSFGVVTLPVFSAWSRSSVFWHWRGQDLPQ